jgi:hypothetical protein
MDFFDVFQREFMTEVFIVLVKELIIKEVLKGNVMSLVALSVAALAGTTDSRGITVVL